MRRFSQFGVFQQFPFDPAGVIQGAPSGGKKRRRREEEEKKKRRRTLKGPGDEISLQLASKKREEEKK